MSLAPTVHQVHAENFNLYPLHATKSAGALFWIIPCHYNYN